MKLPVIGGRGAATSEALIRAVRKGAAELSRAIADCEQAIDGAVGFFTPGNSTIADANAARDVHLPGDSSPAEILSAITAAFASQQARCTMLVPTEARLDDTWQDTLIQHGFASSRRALLLMGSVVEPAPDPSAFQVISARAVATDYLAFLQRLWISRDAAPNAAQELSVAEAGFLDVDALDVLTVRQHGNIIGSVGVLTVAEFGILRSLRVEHGAPPAALETLLWQLLDLCKRSQFRQIVAAVNEGDHAALNAFARIGMKRIATIEAYVRPGIEVLA